MSDNTLKNERDQLFTDLMKGIKPKRVPVTAGISIEAALEKVGYSVKRDQYSPQKCYEAAEEMARRFDTDTLPTVPSTQAAVFRYIDQKFMQPGADGFFQHPNIAPLETEEYPEFSKDPFEFIVNKIQPRVFGILQEEPVLGHLKIKIARDVVASKFAGMGVKLAEQYQRSTAQTTCNLLWAPFDFIADYIRSFSTIMIDVKRNPQWVLDACEAVLQYEIEQIKITPKRGAIPTISYPLHMAPFMKTKDVEKFWWPTFKKLMIATQEAGFIPAIHYEQNWDPHLDLINDIPTPAIITFEASDQKLVAQKVSTNFVWRSMYPAVLLKTGTKQQCIDEAKRTLDNVAGGGNYIFSTNKGAIRGSDVKDENLQAVIEFVKEYGKY
ncbi:uroporphyrinogen decarboxylase (URO-D) [Oxobacter pfennigii]|uniref:Uroporphyrinogen decarboxylase (URO-D) n=1 Tax=Oxobacter pfennigii TaxID=36849 RepID=A0A0N8NSN8_9CLOT|nr:uroporphyrinogen decarboxylase family protein [Oxobacter pfennigii]KPU42552.1 uroporphyrinogen decarboxylase (URO-D) [Oxobacter pfennigii]